MTRDLYPYSQGDRLDDRNTYFYSAFHGHTFLAAWHASRNAALAGLPHAQRPQPLAAEWCENAERLLQRFEVSKRIYRAYDADFKAVRDSGYDDLDLYLRFGAWCVDGEPRPAALRYLNALLKLVDLLISVRERLTGEQGAGLAWLIERERAWVQRIAASVSVAVVP